MSTFRTIVLLWLLLAVACTHAQETQGLKTPVSLSYANELAVRAFLQETSTTVTYYSIEFVERTSTEMTFFIRGLGEFERPGFHWIVKVNLNSGKAGVIAGK